MDATHREGVAGKLAALIPETTTVTATTTTDQGMEVSMGDTMVGIRTCALSNMRLSGRAIDKVPVAMLRRAAQHWR